MAPDRFHDLLNPDGGHVRLDPLLRRLDRDSPMIGIEG
jgi:hypothetical protein